MCNEWVQGKAEVVQRALEVQSLPGAVPVQLVQPSNGEVPNGGCLSIQLLVGLALRPVNSLLAAGEGGRAGCVPAVPQRCKRL